jgi:hypothetical protein
MLERDAGRQLVPILSDVLLTGFQHATFGFQHAILMLEGMLEGHAGRGLT